MKAKVIIGILIAVVVVGGIVFASVKASDFKLPSHSDFREMHGG